MAEFVKTLKLHIKPEKEDIAALQEVTACYRDGCNLVSKYIFENQFPLNYVQLHHTLYQELRTKCGLKSQMAISCIKTAVARYKGIRTQLGKKPYHYQDAEGKWQSIPKTLDWLWRPVLFARPQADLVRNRDYSFVSDGQTLSINTLRGRIRVGFDIPNCFEEYFKDPWTFGVGKIVSLKNEWYLHISMTKEIEESDAFSREEVKHVVGIDRGLRFIEAIYDEKGKTTFQSGKHVLEKRAKFQEVRSQLQAKGTKSAKRALKRISGRENRWMTDVNHQLSKTLVSTYGTDTLFVLEDLTGVSFSEEILNSRKKKQRNQVRSWAFYQLGDFLSYKAEEIGSMVLEVNPAYTSQRCPKCGRIHKENRNHDTHSYTCDCCGYQSNDDRIGAMNLQFLGTLYISGDEKPSFKH